MSMRWQAAVRSNVASDLYFKSVLPARPRILGLRLLPLSLGRYKILRRFGCAFVAEEPAAMTPGDLILGIYICSNRCDEFIRLFDSGKCWKEIKRWGRKIEKESFDYLEKILLFKRYISDSCKPPKYFEEEDCGGKSDAHWSHSMDVILRSELNWTDEEVNEKPLGKAVFDYYKWLENKGAIRLMDDDSARIADENAKALASMTRN